MTMNYLVIILTSGILLLGCRENQPTYELVGPVDTERVVLVEEFSGARCPNCPQGTQELENLKSIYGVGVVIVSIHAGDFAFKYDDSRFDFTTAGGDDIFQLLGAPIGYPSAVINRVVPAGQNSFQTFSSKWASVIDDEVNKEQTVSISAEHSYDRDARDLSIDITTTSFVDIPMSTYLTVLLKEDGIVDPQADRTAETGIVSDYVHKDVLRTVLSDFRGDLLADRLIAFTPEVMTYTYTLPTQDGWWNDEQIQIVAFVSINDGDLIEVLQAFEVDLLP